MKNYIKKACCFCKKYFWYFSLWHVLIFFIKEWKEENLHIASLSKQEKQEISNSRLSHSISFFASVILHLILVLGILNSSFNSVVKDNSVNIDIVVPHKKESITLFDGMISSELKSVYDFNSNIVIDPTSLIQKKINVLDTLLNNLKRSKKPILSSVVSTDYKHKSKLNVAEKHLQQKLSVSKNKKIGKSVTPLKIQLWNNMNLLKLHNKSAKVNYTDIMKVIDKQSLQFRDCYETALLKDDKLSVKVVFTLDLNKTKVKNTKLKLHGEGNKKSHYALSYCLFKQSKKLTFPTNKQNILIKFNLIFGL